MYIISPSSLLRMRYVSDKSLYEIKKIVFKNVFPSVVSLCNSVEKHIMHCWVFTAAMVNRTYNNVVLFTHGPSYFSSLSNVHYDDSWVPLRMYNAILSRLFFYII
jgi:hypothetical protein